MDESSTMMTRDSFRQQSGAGLSEDFLAHVESLLCCEMGRCMQSFTGGEEDPATLDAEQ